MNKKFFTLMAAALVTGSVAAQTYDAGADFEYRLATTGYTKIVTGGMTNPAFNGADLVTGATFSKDVMKINKDYWYQLEVNGDDGFGTQSARVLIQERDTMTGKIYLRIVEKLGDATSSAPLTASLWKIKYSEEDGVSGGKFTFVNKETGYELSYDQLLATDGEVEALGKGISEWGWYANNDNGLNKMDYATLYSVYTDANGVKKIMYLDNATATATATAVNTSLATNGYGCKIANAAATATSLVAVQIENVPATIPTTNCLQIKPVVAAPFFMTKEDFNNRLDSDGDGDFTFTVAGEASNADVLEQAFVAVDGLVANPETAFGDAKYANFNLSFKSKTTTDYLQISTERYEEDKLPSVSPSVKVVVDAAPADADATADKYLKARAMFRATYYPTQDSLLIEPLNAGIMTDKEYNEVYATGSTKTFKDCDAAKKFVVKGTDNQLKSANSVANASMVISEYDEKTVSFTTVKLDNGDYVITVAPASNDGFAIWTSIEQKFSYLKRVAFESGLYNIFEGPEYIVCNFAGDMQLDVPTDNQNYYNMPATMWTVAKKGNEQVVIKNREFGATGAAVFDGQLYVDAAGNYFIIDRSFTGLSNDKLDFRTAYGIGIKENNAIKNGTAITTAVAPQAFQAKHGYYDAEDNLLVKKFVFELNDNLVADHFLNVAEGMFFVPTTGNSSYYEFEEAGTVSFGATTTGVNGLSRKAYNVKVLDDNLIDNDKTWIYQLVEAGRPTYYKAMTEAEATAAGLEKAIFFFKSDEVMGNDKTVETYVLIKADGTSLVAQSQASCESTSKLAYKNLDNTPSEPSTTFAINLLPVKLYRDLDPNKTVEFFLKRGSAYEYLYEASESETFGFLGLTSEGVHQAGENSTPAMASFKVSDHGGIMPEFLFAVDTATVASGYYCPIHGYEVTDPCGHAAEYKGYMTGRFLINLTGDDYKDAYYKLGSYDRLGFVEGIYQEGNLYILTGDQTLAGLKVSKEKGGVIDPAKLAALTPVAIGTPYTFSLRLINREDDSKFLIESERQTIGSFRGGWIKEQGGSAVIARHATTGVVPDHADNVGSIDEIMQDAQVFMLAEGDKIPTANDAIDAAASVKVLTVEGGVQVLNAAGKAVKVVNVLGQTVASTIASSDNAAIAVPAGVVFVSVEGEAAVKAIVK